ncbi:MAG TPA: MmgE/PrpD family protein [Streptosporangiaceae bacterium]
MTGETIRLAEFAHQAGSATLPAEHVERLRWLVLDNLAAGFLGSRQPWSANVAKLASKLGGVGESSIFGRSARLDRARASFVNGAAIGGFEIDHFHSGAHPSSSVFPAVLAAGEAAHVDGDRFLRALAVGYEVAVRVAAAQTMLTEKTRGFHNPAVSGVFGSAAAVAVLHGLPVDSIVSALGIAGSHACGLIEFVWTGAETKRFHLGRSAQLGLESALMAAEGISGPPTVLEGTYGYLNAYSPAPRPELLVEGLGSDWLWPRLTVKPYPVHGTILPLVPPLDQRHAEGIDISAIRQVTIRTGADAAESRHLDAAPASVLGAQYSLPFMVATTLASGADGLVTLSAETLTDAAIGQLARRVRIEERSGPTGRSIADGGEILIEGSGSTEVLTASGVRRLTTDELEVLARRKFFRYSSGILSEAQASGVEDLVRNLTKLDDIQTLAQTISESES